MTAELVLLLSFYVFLVMGIFVHPEWGLTQTFQQSLPSLSARVEKHVACGEGFWKNSGVAWGEPPYSPPQNSLFF